MSDSLEQMERAWHKLVMRLEGYRNWDEIPEDTKQSLYDEAEKARAAALEDVGLGRGGGGALWDSPWTPKVRRSYARLAVTTRPLSLSESATDVVLRGDSLVVAEALANLTVIGEFGPARWKDGKPLRGAPRAGEHTLLRLTRMSQRLREEGSAEAVRDRRPLPEDVLLPGSHGRVYGRYSRRAPRMPLLYAASQAERERFRVMREAEWASLRLQGYRVREIALRAGVSASTVSETGAVRLATSLVGTALLLLAGEGANKSALARELDVDPQRVQRATRDVEPMPESGPEPPPDADVIDSGPWDLRKYSRGLVEEPPSLVELVKGLAHERAEKFGKLLQLTADSFAGREPTMVFRRGEPHVQRPPKIPLRHFGGHRHRRTSR